VPDAPVAELGEVVDALGQQLREHRAVAGELEQRDAVDALLEQRLDARRLALGVAARVAHQRRIPARRRVLLHALDQLRVERVGHAESPE
jgi:hypothetical protein